MVSVVTQDPFGVAADAQMPLLTRALDAGEVERVLGRLAGWEGAVVRAIRAVRYKPGRRCLIEYDVAVPSSGLVTLMGKARARGADHRKFELLRELRRRGFDENAADGICVPEPIAVVPELGLWLRRRVAGVATTEVLGGGGSDGVALARRLAEAAHKVHVADAPARREHTLVDELRTLHERLDALAAQQPESGHRLGRLLAACDRLAATVPEQQPCGIHRDFYPAQALVAEEGKRLYLLDFDLYARGNPALDIGNCIGHITEQAVRTLGDPRALADREAALEDRFVALAGEQTRPAVRAYALLTLARHVSLSAQRVDRQPFTARLLELCEERLAC